MGRFLSQVLSLRAPLRVWRSRDQLWTLGKTADDAMTC